MRFHKLLFSWLCFLVCCSSVLAQSTNGKISGLILDPNGGVIAGAEVLVINDMTGVKVGTASNGEGIYVVPNLAPGSYRLQVSKIGFKTLIKPDIALNVQGALSINFTIPVGAVSDSVTVQGGAPMLNTSDGSVSTVIDQTYVANMPLNGRSFQSLILLTPGAVTNSPQSASAAGQKGEFSINGQRTESNYYTVDGVSANIGASAGIFLTTTAGASGSVPASTALGTTQALVSVDALQEFRIATSSYSAQYGRNPGGQVALETKSGGDRLAGTAFEYLRNDVFDANDWFSNYFGRPKAALRQNDFGGTLGGPLPIPHLSNERERTFFFFSYEGLRLVAPQPATAQSVPDLCMRGMTSCPAGRSPAPATLRPALDAFPLPNTPIEDSRNGFGQFVGTWSNPSSLDAVGMRFDHSIAGRAAVFFRFSGTHSSSSVRSTSIATINSKSAFDLQSYTLGANGNLALNLTNEFRLNYSSNKAISRVGIDQFGDSVPIDLTQATGIPASALQLIYSGYAAELTQNNSSGTQRQWNVIDTFGIDRGEHQLRFGIDFRRLAPFNSIPPANIQYNYTSESSVEKDTSLVNLSARVPAFPLYVNTSAFIQDEWKASQRLSLSLGMRWDVNPAPSVTRGLHPYTLQGITNPSTASLAPQGTPLWQTSWFNFAPRLGLAYVIHNGSNHETVLRGGAGVFFDSGQQFGSASFTGLGFSALTSPVTLIGSFPALPSSVPVVKNPPASPFAVAGIGFAPHLQLPYTMHWNATVEQELGPSQTMSLAYVGSHGARLLQEHFFVPSTHSFPALLIFTNGLTSDYDAFQAQFRRRLTGGLTVLASYTWSHCLDSGSQNVSFGYQRGNCDFDVRNNLSSAFSYDLPQTAQGRSLKAVLNGWGVDGRFSARTAFPVGLDGAALLEPTGEFYHAGLNMIPGEPLYLYGSNCASTLQALGDLPAEKQCPGGRAINPQAFANVTSGFGNVPRNSLRGFGAWQMDLAARREFVIHDNLRAQLRVEAFNVFNHPNFGSVNAALGQQTFGQAISTLANSLGVLNPLYQLGGPRSVQFAIKLVF